jgi:ankyrin repeat protein
MIWDTAVKFKLPEDRDNNGNLPLHVVAKNKQESMCKKYLTHCKGSNRSLLSVKNNQGQTAVHVAINAKPHRIGPERHFAGKHEKGKNQDLKVNKEKEEEEDDDDDEHDFGLPIIRLLWEPISNDLVRRILFERDAYGKTCLHLAAENGKLT